MISRPLILRLVVESEFNLLIQCFQEIPPWLEILHLRKRIERSPRLLTLVIPPPLKIEILFRVVRQDSPFWQRFLLIGTFVPPEPRLAIVARPITSCPAFA